MPSRTKSSSEASLEVRPLRKNDWPILLKLFGDKGACGGCWCMWWRVERGGKLWEESKGARNKSAMKRLVESGKADGLLAFAGGEPVGWCSIGPRGDFPRLDRSRPFQTESPEGTWSVTCFYVKAGWRSRGVAAALLEAAVELARKRKARALEGYPVLPGSAAHQVPAAFAWTGVPRLFEKARFTNLTKRLDERNVFRKALR